MKAVCFLILTTGALMVADGPSKDDPSKGDLDKLRGTWSTVSLVNNGKTLVDEKNTWMIKVGDKTVARGVFKIDSNKKPKEIDIMDESGVKNDKTKLGIYELNGNTYKYCLASAGKPRPTDFTSKEGS